MKKYIALFVLSILWFLPGHGFSADKYDEVAGVLKPYLPAMKRYLNVAENTQNSLELAMAMNQLSDKMEELAPKVRRLSKKYPGLENEQRIPARHMQFRNELELLMQRFTQSYVRIIPHIGDPQVRKANARMLGIMASVGATW
jgi:hypothetical protein